MKKQWLAISQLDRQFNEWQAINAKYKRPRAGWVKTIRAALSLTTEQLASRIGVKGGRISQLEKAEVEDAVTLRALREVGEALNCELVYALVPKNSLTLSNIIKKRAEQVAEEKMNTVAHLMSLEAQALSKEALNEQKHELAKQLTENFDKNLWVSNELVQGIAKVLAQERQAKKKQHSSKLAKNIINSLLEKDSKRNL
ncbi:MAG: mobile mystery protein A [Gammaproteobacteria bacterium]|nr:mobile mystery protein A [Gammaproteobacteria bacterium]